jgi:hypothetical protein
MSNTGLFAGMSPRPALPPVEVRIVVDRGWGERPLTAPWEAYTASEYETLRADLLTQVGDPDGVVSIWTGDAVEVLVPSRRIRDVTITTRPVAVDPVTRGSS